MSDKYTLTDLQRSSIERLKQTNSHVIALSPGCGKTLLCLDFVKNHLIADTDSKCIFMIPKSARAAFEKEMKTRICEPYILIVAGKSYSYNDIVKHKYIFIENTLVNKYVEDLVSLASTNTCHLVIDEAHSLQNPQSVFSTTAWEVRCYCKRVYAMTATPLLNDIEGLFNLYHFVYPSIFTSWFKFRARYCIIKENVIRMKSRTGALIQRKVIDIVGYQNIQELNDILDKLTIKGCVHYNVNFEFIDCALDAQSEKPYNLAASGLFDILYHPEKIKQKKANKKNDKDKHFMDDQKDFGSRLHDLQRCVDGCDIGENDPSFISNKMKLLLENVKKIMDRDESVLVYFEYKDSLEMAERILLANQKDLGFKNIYRLTGAEKEEYRAKIESTLGLREIVLCSQAASQSRNLQRANNLILYNTMFSIGRLIQCTGRICRVDSTYNMQNIIALTVAGTIDEYKVTLLKDHLSLINKLLGNEAMGAVEDCEYLDIDRANMKALKNSLLWRRNRGK